MNSQKLMEVRTALTTSTNTTGVLGSDAGGAEIQKLIHELSLKAYNKTQDLAPLLRRVNVDQLAYIWNLSTESAANSGFSNTSFVFHGDGGRGTATASTKTQLYAVAKAYRADYAVSGLMIASGAANQLVEEARHAVEALAVGEERTIISGTGTSAYGFANGFPGLLQLMGSNATFSDTDTIYGTARAAARDELDVGLVGAGATSADTLALSDLDSAITISDNRGAKANRRVFFCSNDRRDEIDQLLQAQQRFVAPSIEIEGGFRVSSYKNIPIIGSRFMDKNGITWDGATKSLSAADQAMYLLDLDNLFMAHVAGVNATHVPVAGGSNGFDNFSGREDVNGGYYKSYGTLVMKRFDTQVLIYNLTDI
jgi:hypothetical protein